MIDKTPSTPQEDEKSKMLAEATMIEEELEELHEHLNALREHRAILLDRLSKLR